MKRLFAFLSAADLALSGYLLNIGGLDEINPIAKVAIGAGGLLGMAIFKVAIVAGLLGIMSVVRRRSPAAGRNLERYANAVTGAVVAYSALLLGMM